MAIETQSQSLNSKSTRLLSLDIFRGLTIATMITVNEPGIEKYAYAPLVHAHWNGMATASHRHTKRMLRVRGFNDTPLIAPGTII